MSKTCDHGNLIDPPHSQCLHCMAASVHPQMANPYMALGTALVTGVLAGARTEVASRVGTLSERLQNFAFYMTEQQQHPGDALLVMDLHDAVKALRAVGL